MNKVKSPLVKALRKAGYSTKEAMTIVTKAWVNYSTLRSTTDKRHFNKLASGCHLDCAFTWADSPEGDTYWRRIQERLNQ